MLNLYDILNKILNTKFPPGGKFPQLRTPVVGEFYCISVLVFFWFSVSCFLCFSESFPVIYGLNIAIHIRFTIISQVLF